MNHEALVEVLGSRPFRSQSYDDYVRHAAKVTARSRRLFVVELVSRRWTGTRTKLTRHGASSV